VRVARALGRFWYELLVGDDWKIAVSVVVALALTAVVLTQTSAGDPVVAVLGSALVIGSFSLSLALDVRQRPPRRPHSEE